MSITAKNPSPASRDEAWMAWEAANLARLGIAPAKTESRYQKRWRERLQRGRWGLVAEEVRPAHGEIRVVDVFTGVSKWINIMRPHLGRTPWIEFRITDKFPELQGFQREALANGDFRVAAILGLDSIRPPLPSITTVVENFDKHLLLLSEGEVTTVYFGDRRKLHHATLADGRTIYCTEFQELKKFLEEQRAESA